MTILNYNEFMKIINGKKLFKFFPKNFKCHDIQYSENKTFFANKFDVEECKNGIHFTSQDYIFYWLYNLGDRHYVCEIIPDKEANFIIYNDQIKTNMCNIAKLFETRDLIKYLHKEIKLTKKDFQSNKNLACQWACIYGHLDVVKYLHKEIGLTNEDYNRACQLACLYGNIDVIKYLHQELKLSKQWFQVCINYACYYGHLDVVKYLHRNIGLTKEDFQKDDNYACRMAYKNGHNHIVKYLQKEIGFLKEDFQSKIDH